MTTQNYLIVENNIVNNVCVWDGDTSTWTPPADSIQLIQATTPAIVWVGTKVEVQPPTVPPTYIIDYTLQEVIGAGDIGFTWDGTVLTTNQPKPTS
jgi:hypothetical protein